MGGENVNLAHSNTPNGASLVTGATRGQRVDHLWDGVWGVLEGAGSLDFAGYFDHFLGDTIRAEWAPVVTNSGTIAINAQAGGAIRMTTDTGAADAALEALSLSWLVSNGLTVFRARIKQSGAITNRIIECGLTDTLSPSGGLCFSDPSVPTAVDTNAAVFAYKDGSMTTYSALAVNAGGTPQAVTGVATPSTSYQNFAIIIDALGNAEFYVGPAGVAPTRVARIALAVATTSLFSPFIAIKNGSTAAHIQDVDCVSIHGALI